MYYTHKGNYYCKESIKIRYSHCLSHSIVYHGLRIWILQSLNI